MPSQLWFASVIIGGCLVGLASAWWAVDDPRFDLSGGIGPWRIATTDPGAAPYAYARQSRSKAIALGPTEGLTLTANVDSEGHPLSPVCNYRIAGSISRDGLWTLTVTGRDGALSDNPADRHGFSSADALRYGADDDISIAVGPDVRPGDYVAFRDLADPVLTLRYYSEAATARQPTVGDLPTIVRESCGGGRKP